MDNKVEKTKTKTKKNKGQLVVKILAILMAGLMIFSVAISLIYSLMV